MSNLGQQFKKKKIVKIFEIKCLYLWGSRSKVCMNVRDMGDRTMVNKLINPPNPLWNTGTQSFITAYLVAQNKMFFSLHFNWIVPNF